MWATGYVGHQREAVLAARWLFDSRDGRTHTSQNRAVWGTRKAKPVRSRLAADFTGWEQDAQKFEAQVQT